MSADANMEACVRQAATILKRMQPTQPHYLRYCSFYVMILSGAGTSIAAQSIAPDDVLQFRKRGIAEYEILGIRTGGFLVSPGISLDGSYDDNIFRTPTSRQSDFITTVKPAVGIQSNWNRHSLFFGAEGDFGFYRDTTSENYQDYGVLASGQYDFTEETYLIVALSQANRHISRGTLLDPVGASPSEYEATREQFKLARELADLRVIVTGENEDVRLSDTSTTGVPLPTFTKRDTQELGTEVKYEYMPDNSLYSGITYHWLDYTLAGGTPTNANGYDVKSGWEFNNARGFASNLYATYINRGYDAATPDTSQWYPGAYVYWDLTGLASLKGTLDTSFNDTTVSGVGGVVRTTRKVALQYQVTKRTRSEISTAYNHYRYVGGEGAINRGTDVRSHAAGAEYKINDHTGIETQYEFQRRTSPLPSDKYKDNRISLSLTYMY